MYLHLVNLQLTGQPTELILAKLRHTYAVFAVEFQYRSKLYYYSIYYLLYKKLLHIIFQLVPYNFAIWFLLKFQISPGKNYIDLVLVILNSV